MPTTNLDDMDANKEIALREANELAETLKILLSPVASDVTSSATFSSLENTHRPKVVIDLGDNEFSRCKIAGRVHEVIVRVLKKACEYTSVNKSYVDFVVLFPLMQNDTHRNAIAGTLQ